MEILIPRGLDPNYNFCNSFRAGPENFQFVRKNLGSITFIEKCGLMWRAIEPFCTQCKGLKQANQKARIQPKRQNPRRMKSLTGSGRSLTASFLRKRPAGCMRSKWSLWNVIFVICFTVIEAQDATENRWPYAKCRHSNTVSKITTANSVAAVALDCVMFEWTLLHVVWLQFMMLPLMLAYASNCECMQHSIT